HDNLSAVASHSASASDVPIGYFIASANEHHVIYRDSDGHLHELYWKGDAPVAYGGNLTASIGARGAAGPPAAFANASGPNHVVYRATNRKVMSISWRGAGPNNLDDLSSSARAQDAAGDPVAFYTPHDDVQQVIYVGTDGHVWELYWRGEDAVAGWD